MSEAAGRRDRLCLRQGSAGRACGSATRRRTKHRAASRRSRGARLVDLLIAQSVSGQVLADALAADAARTGWARRSRADPPVQPGEAQNVRLGRCDQRSHKSLPRSTSLVIEGGKPMIKGSLRPAAEFVFEIEGRCVSMTQLPLHDLPQAHRARSFATYVHVEKAKFRWLGGREDDSGATNRRPGSFRSFCPTCSSLVPGQGRPISKR